MEKVYTKHTRKNKNGLIAEIILFSFIILATILPIVYISMTRSNELRQHDFDLPVFNTKQPSVNNILITAPISLQTDFRQIETQRSTAENLKRIDADLLLLDKILTPYPLWKKVLRWILDSIFTAIISILVAHFITRLITSISIKIKKKID